MTGRQTGRQRGEAGGRERERDTSVVSHTKMQISGKVNNRTGDAKKKYE